MLVFILFIFLLIILINISITVLILISSRLTLCYNVGRKLVSNVSSNILSNTKFSGTIGCNMR